MPRVVPVSQEERARIVGLLKEHGGNRNRVANLVGRSPSTVQGIAEAEGIAPNIRAPKNATVARKAYAEERRLEIIGKGFDKADALLSGISDAGEFQKWTVGVGTLVDKARLETGEVTDRTENRKGNDLGDFFSELDRKAEEEWRGRDEDGEG
ncbi:MAG: hypothetical protein M3R38_01800 [Actinomycetota bacterium]|nr:hypothetical protein [Actinomycetota bacterium]